MQDQPLPDEPQMNVAVIEDDPSKPWKALLGLLVPGIVALAVAVLPWGDAGTVITDNEWTTILAASGLTGLGVYVKKNPKRAKRLS